MEEPPAPAETTSHVPTAQVKTRKKREMTPELLDKLRLARERAAELRAQAKETKSKLPADLPEKERSKVAQYLATRKAIKAKIKEEVLTELEAPARGAWSEALKTEHPVDSKGYSLPMPKEEGPPVPQKTEPIPVPVPKKVKEPLPESDDEDEYTTIKVPKKKIIKWTKYAERPVPEPEKPKNNRPQFNPYTTQHLIGLAMNGYNF